MLEYLTSNSSASPAGLTFVPCFDASLTPTAPPGYELRVGISSITPALAKQRNLNSSYGTRRAQPNFAAAKTNCTCISSQDRGSLNLHSTFIQQQLHVSSRSCFWVGQQQLGPPTGTLSRLCLLQPVPVQHRPMLSLQRACAHLHLPLPQEPKRSWGSRIQPK